MEHEKITSKDKLIYAITLASIFFGVLGLGMLGVVVKMNLILYGALLTLKH